VSVTNHTLVILDIIKGLIAVVAGNIGLPTVIRYLADIIRSSEIPILSSSLLTGLICLLIMFLAYHKTRNKIIRALVIACLFIPVLLILLSYFTVLKVPVSF